VELAELFQGRLGVVKLDLVIGAEHGRGVGARVLVVHSNPNRLEFLDAMQPAPFLGLGEVEPDALLVNLGEVVGAESRVITEDCQHPIRRKGGRV
jgi:hypothetical protein